MDSGMSETKLQATNGTRGSPRRAPRATILGIVRLGGASLLLAYTLAAAVHANAADAPAYSKKGADTCLSCHDDPEVKSIFATPHAQPADARSPFGHGQLQCESCHGPGDAHARGKGKTRPGVIRFGKGATTPPTVQNAQCLACHASTKNHWAVGPHAANDVSCADCHSSHAAHDPILKAANQGEVCGTCHKAQHAAEQMPYRHPLAEGKMACTSCHTPHGSNTPTQLVRNSVTETCTSCHADLRGPFLWEHQPVTEDCSICHSPHGAVQPAMLKARGPFLCQQCHQASGHPSLAYGSNNLPGRGTPTPYVIAGNCLNCHPQVHGSNHPSGAKLMR